MMGELSPRHGAIPVQKEEQEEAVVAASEKSAAPSESNKRKAEGTEFSATSAALFAGHSGGVFGTCRPVSGDYVTH